MSPQLIEAKRFDREIELLLHCARRRVEPERGRRIRELASCGIDWDELLAAARRHYIAPLIYASLRIEAEGLVPSHTEHELAIDAQRSAQRALFLSAELSRLLLLFEAHGIPSIVFKGPLFAREVYGSLGLRDFYDVDLLIPRESVLKAKGLLLAAGYFPEYGPLGPLREAMRLRFHCEYNFCRRGGLPIELHWRLSPTYINFPIDIREVWQRAVSVRLNGGQALGLSTEDLVLFLCLHNGGKHCWLVLRWLCDLAELLRSREQELDWGRLFERARRVGSERLLAIGLILAREVLDVPLACDCLRLAYRDPRATAMATMLRARLVSTRPVDREDTALDRCVLYFRMRERALDRLLYLPHLARRLVTPTKRDRRLVDARGALALVYLMTRPVRLVVRYAAIAVKRAVRGTARRREGRCS